MTALVATRRFLEESAQVYFPKVMEALDDALAAMELFPNGGSKDVPDSIKALYGEKVQKAYVPPFDLVYYYDEDSGKAYLLGLVHFRQAH